MTRDPALVDRLAEAAWWASEDPAEGIIHDRSEAWGKGNYLIRNTMRREVIAVLDEMAKLVARQ